MKRIKLIFAMLFIAATVTGFFEVGFIGKPFDIDETEIILDSGWEVKKNGEILGIFDFSKDKILYLKKGDTIEVSGFLEENEYEDASLKVSNFKSDLIVSVDGVNIYSYGVELYDKGGFLGEGDHFIKLPSDYAKKKLTITMRACEANGIGNFKAPVIAPTDRIKINIIRQDPLTLGVSMALLVFSFICIGVALLFINNLIQWIFVGFFSFFMGMWSLCNSDLILLFNSNIESKTFTQYFSLLAAPLFIFLFYGIRGKDSMGKRQRIVFRILAVIDGLAMLMFLVLHLTGTLYISSTVLTAHILIVVLLSFMIYLIYDGRRTGREEAGAFEVGMATMCVCAFADVLIYYLKNYSEGIWLKDFGNFSFFGALMLVVSMILEMEEELHKKIQDQAELKLYEKLAYADELTGLSNRRECEVIFDEIEKEKTKYAVISLDLNNLKKVNDRYGHEMGDNLLKDCANVLKESFGAYGTVARSGGDEFAVIIKNSAVLNVDKLIEEMEQKVDELNEKRVDYQLSVAAGFALWSEEMPTVREAFRLADERMYKNKAEMKKAMKGSRG